MKKLGKLFLMKLENVKNHENKGGGGPGAFKKQGGDAVPWSERVNE